MTEPTIDVARLRKELEFVTNHPEHWNQANWALRVPRCGTVGCLAGNTVLHAGVELNWFSSVFDGRLVQAAGWTADGRSIEVAAAELLGLTEPQAEKLFYAGNSLRDLWKLAERFTNGEVGVPVDLPDWADERYR